MNPSILDREVQEFIRQHTASDVNPILLKKSPFATVSSKEIAEQIDSRNRCEKKLPTWFNTPQIYYPPKLAVEQSSSEATAVYKSQLAIGGCLIDLTGGFGVDSYFFSSKVNELIHCELNPDLSDIAQYNSKILDAKNIRFINGNGINYLQNTDTIFDTIYIDPARRVENRKVFLLKDCEPDVVSNFKLLLSKTRRLIIKTSPLIDLQSGLKELANVSEIHIISVKNDCKEVLWVIDKDFEGEAAVKCVLLNEQQKQSFSFNFSEEKSIAQVDYSKPERFLYEPDVALLKAGCFKLITKRLEIKKLHPNTHLYTSENLENSFPGRKFKIVSAGSYKDFIKYSRIKKANIITRNFPSSPEQLKKKHKLADGGTDYLIFCTGSESELLTLHAERI
ncbi:class I SAM-dependent methyltransferase [Rubrolithibacter danxiaensis]|uniref:class I SAM-dependent methyltransferase n=1 Tax=Rubrolithibacter danxiaensis TaxID=3390805 RepID=UPI003BF91734